MVWRRKVTIEPFAASWSPVDRILLCTDGISDVVEPHVIARILLTFEDPGAAASRLVERAYEVGGRDNATAIVLQRARRP